MSKRTIVFLAIAASFAGFARGQEQQAPDLSTDPAFSEYRKIVGMRGKAGQGADDLPAPLPLDVNGEAGGAATAPGAAPRGRTPMLAVVDFDSQNVSKADRMAIADALHRAVSGNPGFQTFGIQETRQRLERAGLVSEDPAKAPPSRHRVAEMLSADYLILGTVNRVDGSYAIMTQLFSASLNSVLKSDTRQVKGGLNNLQAAVPKVAAELFKGLPGSSTSSSIVPTAAEGASTRDGGESSGLADSGSTKISSSPVMISATAKGMSRQVLTSPGASPDLSNAKGTEEASKDAGPESPQDMDAMLRQLRRLQSERDEYRASAEKWQNEAKDLSRRLSKLQSEGAEKKSVSVEDEGGIAAATTLRDEPVLRNRGAKETVKESSGDDSELTLVGEAGAKVNATRVEPDKGAAEIAGENGPNLLNTRGAQDLTGNPPVGNDPTSANAANAANANSAAPATRGAGTATGKPADKPAADAPPAAITSEQKTQAKAVYEESRKATDANVKIGKLRAAVNLDPSTVQYHVDLAKTLYSQKDYDKSIEATDAALALHPRETLLYTLRGAAFAQKNDLDNAEKSYRQALKADPKDAFAQYNLALTIQQANKTGARKGEAIAAWERYFAIAPDDPRQAEGGWLKEAQKNMNMLQ